MVSFGAFRLIKFDFDEIGDVKIARQRTFRKVLDAGFADEIVSSARKTTLARDIYAFDFVALFPISRK